jgi:hypothetical protein
MDNKKNLKKIGALCLALALTLGATGCGEFVRSNGLKDLQRTVAKVDISAELVNDDKYSAYADDIQTFVENGWLSSAIPKRDLVAAFLSKGYYYVNNYGYSYADTFNMLMDELVNQKILAQYAITYYMSKMDDNATSFANRFTAYKTAQVAAETDDTKKALLEAHPEVLTMKYFLTGGENTPEALQEYNEALYSLKSSFNSSLDSAEKGIIAADEAATETTSARTLPTNVNATVEEYYPIENGVLDYDVYTGYNALTSCGEYEAVDGSTPVTRQSAYYSFLANLQSYNLIKENENTADITKIDYFYLEFSNVLTSKLIAKFTEGLEQEAIDKFTDTEALAEYNRLSDGQTLSYENGGEAFETALDGVSDTSFVLYGQEGYGFVYNILLPFSTAQTQAYTAAKNKVSSITDAKQKQNAIYNARKQIGEGIVGKDLREAWFNTDEDAHYAYAATGEYFNQGTDKYLFFDNNVNNTAKYKELTVYAGSYPYNGTATLADDEWDFTPTELTIKQFIPEMEGYINYLLEKSGSSKRASGTWLDSQYGANAYNTNYYNGETVSYDKFMSYAGKVDGLKGSFDADNYFYKGAEGNYNDSYTVASAVNELMFAYSTDTGCLNTYFGYAVSPYKTDFVKEFEYAAQYVVKEGVGTYAVTLTDYGWHIVYCTFAYQGGEVYTYNANDKETKGTFSYMFYETMKNNAATTAATSVQNNVMNKYSASAIRYVEKYQDLLDLDKA